MRAGLLIWSAPMPRISVFLPTHEHASTLPYAVRSVQQQGVDDLEILICGDGVTDAVRDTVAELQRADARIRFFDLPKAPARGELNRDHVLRQAEGRIVFHQNDDDLWLPGHIEALERALDDADFVGAVQVNVDPDGKVRMHYFDLERPEFVEPWLKWEPHGLGAWACNGFGPIFVAHTRDAFLRLPEGWTTTPAGLPADQAMWHRFLREPWCRVKFLRWPVALHFESPDRRHWTPEQRADELRRWTEIIEAPDHAARMWRDLLPDLGDRLLQQSLTDRMQRRAYGSLHSELDATRQARDGALAREQVLRSEVDALHQTLEAALAREQAVRAEMDGIRAAGATAVADARREGEAALVCARREAEVALAREHALRAQTESERDALVSSTAWRLTAPLRWVVNRLRRFE